MVRDQPQRLAFCGCRVFRNLDSRKGANRPGRVDRAYWHAAALERLAIGICTQLSGREYSCDIDGSAGTQSYHDQCGADRKALSAAGQPAVEYFPLSRLERFVDP